MKRFTKALLILLCFCMALPFFAGCKKNEKPSDVTDSSNVTTEKKEPEVPGNYDSELPDDLDYQLEEITMICRDMPGQNDEFRALEGDKNIISSAVLKRNLNLENRLNVVIKVVPVADTSADTHFTVMKKAEIDITSGSGEFDVITMPAYTGIPNATRGLFYNLNELNHINLDKYYWAQGFNKEFEVGPAQYFATGAIALSLYRFMYVTVYNNPFFQSHNMEDIYDLVKENRWTMEEQYRMAADLYVDDGLNPDEKDEKDTYGFLSGARTTVDAYLASCDAKLIGHDNDNYYTLTANVEKVSGIADKMIHLFFESEGSYIVPVGRDNPDNADIIRIFKTGKTAMATMKVHGLETGLRDATFEYSIAPLPKYDDQQERYGTLVQDQVTIVSVPYNLNPGSLDMIGAFLECLADESYQNTYSAYFETALSYQYLQNPESVEMLQIIYESVDFSVLSACLATDFSWNSMMRNVATAEYNSVAQQLGGNAFTQIRTNLDNFNQSHKDLINSKK